MMLAASLTLALLAPGDHDLMLTGAFKKYAGRAAEEIWTFLRRFSR